MLSRPALRRPLTPVSLLSAGAAVDQEEGLPPSVMTPLPPALPLLVAFFSSPPSAPTPRTDSPRPPHDCAPLPHFSSRRSHAPSPRYLVPPRPLFPPPLSQLTHVDPPQPFLSLFLSTSLASVVLSRPASSWPTRLLSLVCSTIPAPRPPHPAPARRSRPSRRVRPASRRRRAEKTTVSASPHARRESLWRPRVAARARRSKLRASCRRRSGSPGAVDPFPPRATCDGRRGSRSRSGAGAGAGA